MYDFITIVSFIKHTFCFPFYFNVEIMTMFWRRFIRNKNKSEKMNMIDKQFTTIPSEYSNIRLTNVVYQANLQANLITTVKHCALKPLSFVRAIYGNLQNSLYELDLKSLYYSITRIILYYISYFDCI